MAIDDAFLAAARKAFDPFRLSSGTEHMAPFLYSLVRMVRPVTVVEFGSGYTTLFVLRALADNVRDVEEERRLLLEKATALGELPAELGDFLRAKVAAAGNVPPAQAEAHGQQLYLNWLSSGGRSCMVDPAYYLEPYAPHLYSFEALPEAHPYVGTMRGAVREIGHDGLFTHLHAETFSRAAVPGTIDLAWNDDHSYRRFFQTFWPALNPKGGIFVFHNVTADPQWWGDVAWMKAQRARAGDLEALVLQEPHKLNQNGCAILRRTSEYRPPFALSDPGAIYRSLRRFLGKEPRPPAAPSSAYRSLRRFMNNEATPISLRDPRTLYRSMKKLVKGRLGG